MNEWNKTFTKIIDQRQKMLSNVWCNRPLVELQSDELNPKGVHRSGRQRKLAHHLCDQIDSAKEMVVISSFLMADDELEKSILRAAKRRVRVYLLLASENRLDHEPRVDSEFDQRVYEEHKQMLNRLAGWVLIRSAADIHAKVILIDPTGSKPSGTLLTANLTKEALERNEELAVDLTIHQIDEVFNLLRWAMWENAEHEMLVEGRFHSVKPLREINAPATPEVISVTCRDRQTIRESLLQIIESATNELIVSSFGWDKDHAVVKRLCQRAHGGLKVTILSRVRPASMPALLELRRAGARVLGFDWLHAKAIWSDTPNGMIMTANLESHGLDQGFEIGVPLEGAALISLEQRLRNWIESAAWEFHTEIEIGELEGKIKLLREGRLGEAVVLNQKDVPLKSVAIQSLDQYESAVPEFPSTKEPLEFAHELIYKWQVEAPKLTKKSKQHFQPVGAEEKESAPYQPPVYKEPNGRFVIAIRKVEEMEKAVKLKAELKADVDVKSIVLYEEP